MGHSNIMRKLRKERELTQKELAEKLGIGESTYCGYENFSREPSYELLIRIADFFGVSLDYLLGHQIPGMACTMSPEELEVLEKYYHMSIHSRNLVNQLIDMIANFEEQISGCSQPRQIICNPGTGYAVKASRDGDSVRIEPMTQQELEEIKKSDPLEDI